MSVCLKGAIQSRKVGDEFTCATVILAIVKTKCTLYFNVNVIQVLSQNNSNQPFFFNDWRIQKCCVAEIMSHHDGRIQRTEVECSNRGVIKPAPQKQNRMKHTSVVIMKKLMSRLIFKLGLSLEHWSSSGWMLFMTPTTSNTGHSKNEPMQQMGNHQAMTATKGNKQHAEKTKN